MSGDVVDFGNAPEVLEDLPPSCRLVWLYLETHGEQTQKQIIDGTMSNGRTVRYALDRLDEAGVLTTRPSTRDARQTLYSVEAVELAES